MIFTSRKLSSKPLNKAGALALASLLAMTAGLLPGCGAKQAAADDPGAPLNTGLDSLAQAKLDRAAAQQKALSDLAERSAVDLERILAAQQQVEAAKATARQSAAAPAAPAPVMQQPVAATPVAQDPAQVAAVEPAAAAVEGQPGAGAAPDATDPDVQAAAVANGIDPAVLAAALAAAQQAQQMPVASLSEQRIPQLAGDLATLIRRRAETSQSPLADYLVLASLESAQPGILGDGNLSSKVTSKLSSPEVQLLTAFRAFIAAMAPAGVPADPVSTAARMADAFPSVAAVLPLRIADARLCTRVSGFGAYAPFASNVFQAGQPQAAIVYVEVDRFAHRPAKSSDPGVSDVPTFNTPELWAVELSQELNLHHDADGSLQWRQAPQVVVEASRRQRRDFYLIQQIELPPTLTVGNYSLKITIRDRVNDAVAEAVVPIQIVADAGLAAGQN